MRNYVVAGAAALILGTTMTPVFAGPFWVMGKVVKECYYQGVYEKDAVQVQCGSNSVDYGDDNKQILKQKQKAFVWYVYEGQTLQVQLGTNDVDDGDDNTQIIDQQQFMVGSPSSDNVQQMQVGKNDVEDGDDNFQKIEQSQGLITFGPS